uniref:DNA cytosine methyltransferase n=1 Tax=Pseudomonas sp. WP18 TaxID=3118752 RepID=UPI00403F1DF1
MHASSKTCVNAAPITSPRWISSPPVSPASTSASPDEGKQSGHPRATQRPVLGILKEIQPGWVVLENVVNLLAVDDSEDFETVIRALADWGMWDFAECLMLNISKSPCNVVEYSWSPVIDACLLRVPS